MRIHLSTLILGLFLFSCVGTIEDNEKVDKSSDEQVEQNFSFSGASEGLWVSNTALSVRFPPAVGGSGLFRYELLDGGGNVITGEDQADLIKDSNGLYHLTFGGFTSGEIHRLLIRATDIESDIKDNNKKYVEVNLPDEFYPDFDGFESCSPVAGTSGGTQISINWTQGAVYPGSFGLPLPHSVGSYNVYYCTKNDGTDCLETSSAQRGEQVILDPLQTSVVISGLANNTEYFFRVTATSVGITGNADSKFEERNIEFGSCKTELSSGPIVFDGITDVIIADGEAGMNEATVVWEQATGGYQGYIVYYHPIVDQNSSFNYLDPNIQKVVITDTLAVDRDLIGLDSFTYHAFLVKACPDLVGDPDCNDGNDAGEKFIRKETKPPVAIFGGIDNTANDPLNPSNVFLNFEPVSLSNGGIFDEYKVILNDGTNDYDITNSSVSNTLGDIYPAAPATYQPLYLDGFVRTNILSTYALVKGLQPGIIYSADVQAWVDRSAPLPISGGTISVAYGTTNTAPVNISNSDTTPPLIAEMTVTPPNGILVESDTLTFSIRYNENINVTGTPRIAFDVGGVTRNADLVSVASPIMTFEYTIVAGDNDLDGLSFSGNSILLNGGSIVDLSGNNANLNFSALAPDISVINVDTLPPAPPTNITFTLPWLSSVEAIQVAAWTNPATDFAYANIGIGSSGSNIPNAVAFTQANSTAGHTFPDIRSSLVECIQEYEVVVQSVDAAGLVSTNAASPLKFKYDATPPQAVTVTLGATTSDVFVANEVSWSISSDTCELSHYEIAIGRDDDGDGFDPGDVANTLGWSEMPGEASTTNYTATSGVDGMIFSLNASDDFYVSIRGVDAAGNPGAVASSAAWQVDLAGPSAPADLAITQQWINGALPMPSPTVSWTNPTDPDFDHIKIALGSTIGQEDIRTPTNIGTFSSYSWPNITSSDITECNKNFPKIIAYDDIGNPSLAATNPNVFFTYDDTAPSATGDLDISVGGESLNDNRGPLTGWSSSASILDNCNAIKTFEMAIGFDNDGDGFDVGDAENLATFRVLPGGNTVDQYQVESGTDGYNFNMNGGVDYYLSLRVTDEAGNVSTILSASTPFSFVLDNTAPIPTITSSEVSPSSSAVFPITVTFDEDVFNFSSGGINVTNGTVSNFTQVSASVYTADITPGDLGGVYVDIPVGSALDAAGNPSAAATTFKVIHSSANPMVSVWQVGSGDSVTLPLRPGFQYDALIDWGDGSTLTDLTSATDPNRTHTYTSAGNYTITIYGKLQAWYFNNTGDKDKIVSVSDLGNVGWTNMDSAFQGCQNLTIVNGGDMSLVTRMYEMFYNAPLANPSTINWDVGSVTSMDRMFYNAVNADPNTTDWDVSNVTNMGHMFLNAENADPDTENWDVSKVTYFWRMFESADTANPNTENWITTSANNMGRMFRYALNADPDVSGWNMSLVTNVEYMFEKTAANPTVTNWDVGNVTNFAGFLYDADNATPITTDWDTARATSMVSMFRRAALANPDTTNWDVGLVTNMNCMFCETDAANPNTTNWDTARVINMTFMFWNAAAASPDTTNWDTSRVTNMSYMFQNADLANPVTSGWDTALVTNMTSMFRYAQNANPITTNWNTSNVNSMAYMFDQAVNANPNTTNWDTSNVTTMREMFYRATNADPNTSGWDTAKVNNMYRMFRQTSADPDTLNWNTAEVTTMQQMFYQNAIAAPRTENWDTSKVTSFQNTFGYARSANPDTSGWDTANVTSMGLMFQYADIASPDTSNWDTTKVTRMDYMFRFAFSANPVVDGWNVSNVTNMRETFRDALAANPDVSGWDTSNVTNMYYMFRNADNFDRDMSSWDLSSLGATNSLYQIFYLAGGLSNANWGSFLNAAAATATLNNATQVRSQADYPASAAADRDFLINNLGWQIIDGGPE